MPPRRRTIPSLQTGWFVYSCDEVLVEKSQRKGQTFKAETANQKEAEKEEESKEEIAAKIERFLGDCKEEESLK